jgi:hypothetical protein
MIDPKRPPHPLMEPSNPNWPKKCEACGFDARAGGLVFDKESGRCIICWESWWEGHIAKLEAGIDAAQAVNEAPWIAEAPEPEDSNEDDDWSIYDECGDLLVCDTKERVKDIVEKFNVAAELCKKAEEKDSY